jgi:long-chain acyl-CoA synthetase
MPGVDGAGTVGIPFPGTEFKLGPDGEVMTRGVCTFKGYYKNEAATREAIDADGWFHTGDLGKLNDRGQVQLTGRKRDILKTSGGKMLAPSPIEESLKGCNFIGQVCILGDNRKYFVALVTLSELAQAKGGINGPGIQEAIQSRFDEINKGLASYEQIKRFKILDRDFSIEAGEMTPTLKMKRNIIEKNFADLIEEMYPTKD